MPQVIDAPPPTGHETSAPERSSAAFQPQDAQFDYHPIPMTAIVGMILALLSLTALATWKGIPIAAIAVILSGLAFLKIWRAAGEYSGKWLAVTGVSVSVACIVLGVILEMQRLRNEIPPGFQRLSFSQDISAKKFGIQESNGKSLLEPHPEIIKLVGKKIYVKGFMYPGANKHHLTQFIACKDNDECCFGGQPDVTDMIGVSMTDKNTVDYDKALMGIAGTFKLNQYYTGGENEPLYLI